MKMVWNQTAPVFLRIVFVNMSLEGIATALQGRNIINLAAFIFMKWLFFNAMQVQQ